MRKTPLGRWVVTGGWMAAGLLVFAASAQEVADKNPYTGNPEAIAEGQRLYIEMGCDHCHGKNAEGGMGPDLSDEAWLHRPTDGTQFKIISRGVPGTTMTPWQRKLSPDQIWKVLAFIRSRYGGDPATISW